MENHIIMSNILIGKGSNFTQVYTYKGIRWLVILLSNYNNFHSYLSYNKTNRIDFY